MGIKPNPLGLAVHAFWFPFGQFLAGWFVNFTHDFNRRSKWNESIAGDK